MSLLDYRIGINVFVFLQELLKSGGKSEVPAIEIKPEILNGLYDSYECAMSETKNVIQSEINSKVQKSVDLKRRYKSNKQK